VLRFSLAGIPVGVHLSFLIIAIVSPSNRPVDMALWVTVAFLAVLLHEAGHAFTARRFGAEPVSITLFALGGLTSFGASERLGPGRRLAIAAAGSAVGIVAGGAVWVAWNALAPSEVSRTVDLAVRGFIWASLGWGLLNWIPIRPLDGGAILTSFLEIVIPKRAFAVAKVISAIAGAAAAFFLWRMGSTFGAVFVVLITLTGLRSDPAERHPPRKAPPSGGTTPVAGEASLSSPGDTPAGRPMEGGDRPEPPPPFPI
jgi:Zn-dependent protease